jgi:hypothetical protein
LRRPSDLITDSLALASRRRDSSLYHLFISPLCASSSDTHSSRYLLLCVCVCPQLVLCRACRAVLGREART